MYGFSEDEQLLVFMDGFGLTRLRRPKQAKTNAKISGSESGGRVTISRDGSVAASYEDLWDKSVIWSLPGLAPAKRFDRFRQPGAIVHPEGTHYIVDEYGVVKLEPITRRVLLPLRLDAPAHPGNEPAKPASLQLDGGERLPPLEFDGGRKQSPDVPVPLRIAHDGTLLRFDGGELIYATLTGTSAKVHWRRAVHTAARAHLELYADAERCVLMVHRDRRWTIVERMTQSGNERTFEIECLGVPAVAGRYLGWQPAPDRVVRRDLDTDEQTEHSLAIYATARKLELRNEGVGTIMLGAKGSLLVLANHRESILDLIAEVEIPRKLSPKNLDIRQAALAIARPYVEAAPLAGVCIELGHVELDAKRKSMSVSHRIAGGDSLLGSLLAAHSSAVWRDCPLPNGWRMSSYGSAGGMSYDPNLTLAELVEGYSMLAKHGIGFASTIDFWQQQLQADGKPPKAPACLALLAQALVAVVGDGPEKTIDYAALAERGMPSIEEILTAYRVYPQRAQSLGYSCTRFTAALFNRLYGADAAQLWIALYLEAKGWEHYGSHWSDFGSYGVEPLLDAHPELAEQFKAWFRSHEVPEGGRQYYLDQLRQRLGD